MPRRRTHRTVEPSRQVQGPGSRGPANPPFGPACCRPPVAKAGSKPAPCEGGSRWPSRSSLPIPRPFPFPLPSVARPAPFPFPSVARPTSCRLRAPRCVPRRCRVPDPGGFDLLGAPVGCATRSARSRERLDRPQLRGRGRSPRHREAGRRSVATASGNIAEGSGRFTPAEKAHFYLIARGSAMECLAALSLLQARSLVSPEVYRRSRSLLARIVAMLTRLAAAMQRRAAPPSR